MSQYPADAEKLFAVVLGYTVICFLCNCLLLWLVWTQNDKFGYTSCLGYFSLLSTICSMVRQTYNHTRWIDYRIATHEAAVANLRNSVIVATPETGLGKVIFIIQNYCYVVEALLVLFWAFSLTQTVYGWRDQPKLRSTLLKVNIAGKFISVLLPMVQIGLQQVVAIQKSYIGYMILCNALFALSCGGGALFLLMILWRYIQTRRQFKGWNFGYWDDAQQPSQSGSIVISDDAGRGPNAPSPRPVGIYDRWLITRFTLAFLFVCTIEVFLVLFQISSQKTNTADALASMADLSAARAKGSAAVTAPGVTGSLVAFIVFGTTEPLRKKMYQTFVPKRFQRPTTASRANVYILAADARLGHELV